MSATFILAQVSDAHILTERRMDSSGALHDHVAQLRKAFAAMREFRPDAILVTGDLVNDARADEYAVLADVLLAAPAPLYVLPGNHDDPALLRRALPEHLYLPRAGPLSFVIEDYPVRLVCIDQILPGKTHGVFTADHARWLEAALAAALERPTLIALHHPPFLTHDRLFDTIGLEGGERFADVIARHRQVERIICGHHHRGVLGQVAHVPVIVAPSTAWTYSDALREEQPLAGITSERPGWVLHAWSPKARFASHFMGL
jgi:3',5'-cyclic AMP phosphodiesterase CpdA